MTLNESNNIEFIVSNFYDNNLSNSIILIDIGTHTIGIASK